MSDRENKIGIHASTLYPRNLFISPVRVWDKFSKAGAEFMVHQPGYTTIDISDLPRDRVKVDDNWWFDRVVERKTPLEATGKNMLINIITCLPIPPAKGLTGDTLRTAPGVELIRRWVNYPPELVSDPERRATTTRRNEVIKGWSENIPPNRTEILDVHANIGLTPQELIDWMKSDYKRRRLMISALDIDERIDKYDVPRDIVISLTAPLLPYVSAVTLKLGELNNSQGKPIMSEEEVIGAIAKRDFQSPYAQRLKRLSEIVGTQLPIGTNINWIIKVKPWYLGGTRDSRVRQPDFLSSYTDFVKEVVR